MILFLFFCSAEHFKCIETLTSDRGAFYSFVISLIKQQLCSVQMLSSFSFLLASLTFSFVSLKLQSFPTMNQKLNSVVFSVFSDFFYCSTCVSTLLLPNTEDKGGNVFACVCVSVCA